MRAQCACWRRGARCVALLLVPSAHTNTQSNLSLHPSNLARRRTVFTPLAALSGKVRCCARGVRERFALRPACRRALQTTRPEHNPCFGSHTLSSITEPVIDMHTMHPTDQHTTGQRHAEALGLGARRRDPRAHAHHDQRVRHGLRADALPRARARRGARRERDRIPRHHEGQPERPRADGDRQGAVAQAGACCCRRRRRRGQGGVTVAAMLVSSRLLLAKACAQSVIYVFPSFV